MSDQRRVGRVGAESPDTAPQGPPQRPPKTPKQRRKEAQWTLFGASVAGGIFVALVLEVLCEGEGLAPWFGLPGLGYLFLHARLGSWAISWCEDLRRWAYPDDHKPWSVDERMQQAAFWPFVLLFWLVIAPAWAEMNRLFKDDP